MRSVLMSPAGLVGLGLLTMPLWCVLLPVAGLVADAVSRPRRRCERSCD